LARSLLGIWGTTGSDNEEAAILELTQNAVAAFRRVIAETGDNDILGIRIAASGGCSGYQYELGLEAEAREGDAVIHFDDVMVFVDAESKAALAGVEVDFCESPQAAGFVFHQPNSCGSCGKRKACGS
ncbi:MAG: iron-sulfur cluster assembly accessory protein, partial [Rhizomicrobium sp.]|nr:iron-sulfur cluster assembly accessory protein [Rhizomicrobium sp.]